MFKGKKIHLIGIGGISMSAIAYMLKGSNSITGSDQNSSTATDDLIKNNIRVAIPNDISFIKDADIVIYTSAISESDVELVEAKRLKKEIYERSVALGLMSKEYKHSLCVAGTHGKSSTTGILSSIFLEAKKDPTIQIGAYFNLIKSNYLIGRKEFLILESCEYKDSFLEFFPSSAIVTNIDKDHLDYFKNLRNIKKSFSKFADLISNDGYLIVNADDKHSSYLKARKNALTFGIKNKADYQAKNITYSIDGYPSFQVYKNYSLFFNITLSVKGEHNIYNSLSAIALSNKYIENKEYIKLGLEKYTGVGRRFEYIGDYKKSSVFDDYAHHPNELKTTYDIVTKTKHNKNWVIFQPHTFSRLKKHYKSFAKTLSCFDNVIIAPIFAAREINTFNISEDDLLRKIKKRNKNASFINSSDEIIRFLKDNVEEKDIIIFVGAGDINKLSKKLIS